MKPEVRIGVVACEIFKHELEMLTEDDPDIVVKVYVEFGLHVYPEELRRAVIEKIDSLQGQVDTVFLGYGVCQSLENVPNQVKVPTVALPVDDCISALLTPTEYAKEKALCTGTWFASPGWAEIGKEGLIKNLHLDSLKDQGYPPELFLKMIYESYSRGLFIDTGIPEAAKFKELSEQFAQEIELKHECRNGTLEILKEGLRQTKELAMKLQTVTPSSTCEVCNEQL
jgi:hypothetical protein